LSAIFFKLLQIKRQRQYKIVVVRIAVVIVEAVVVKIIPLTAARAYSIKALYRKRRIE
jgi:hypothetical protein